MTRRRAGLENQRLNREENFRKMEMNRAVPAYDVNAFGDRIDTFNADQGAGLNIENAPPLQKPVPEVVTPPEVGLDGTSVLAPKDGGVIEQGTLVPTEETELTYPAVDPDRTALPDASMGAGYREARSAERLRRRGINSQIMEALRQNKTGYILSDIRKFYTSKDFQDFIYQNPQFLDEIKEDPEGFAERYQAERPSRVSNEVTQQSTTRTDTLIASRKKRLADDVLYKKAAAEIVRAANDMGVDPIAALAIAGIESDFGANTGKSAKGARGAMQVMPAQANNLKKWFGDPANIDQVNKAFTSRDGFVNKRQIEYVLRKIQTAKPDSIQMGMAQLIYNKAIGLDKKLWGAGYQGNANSVLAGGKPTLNDDGNITNSDYNRAYVDLYNDIITNHGAKLAETYTNLADLDLTQIQGTGMGRPLLTQSPASSYPVIVKKNGVGAAQNVRTATLGGGTDPFFDGDEGDGTGEDVATVDNTGRSMGVNPQGVTDSGGGLKKDGGGSTDKILKKPEDAPKLITKLAKNPDQLGFEFSEALKIRNVIAQRTENMRRAGMTGINRPEYAKGIADIMVLDSSLYVMQAYDALNQFGNTGNPDRLNSVIDAFSGGTARIQARTDGKFDFIRPDGSPIEGLTGLDKNGVELNSRTIFDSKYRSSIEAAVTAKNQAMFESQLKQEEEQSKILTQGQMDIMKKRLEGMGYDTEITSDGQSMVVTKDGQPVRSYTKQLREVEGPDDTTLEEEIFVPDGQVFQIEQGVGNAFLDAVSKIGKGQ
jgi:hypothetical protein